MLTPVTVDFETFAIESRPIYPPVPVGAALKEPGRRARYLAWGHPDGNNTTRGDASRILQKLWRGATRRPLLFHNAKFDLDVAEEHLGLRPPPWHAWHDTMFLAFLADPHSKVLSLKPLAERYLDEPPSERDELFEWLYHNLRTSEPGGRGAVYRRTFGKHRIPKSRLGAFIAYGQGGLVGRYACGDVDRTAALFKILHGVIKKHSMSEAYDRERRLAPILLKMERRGVRVSSAKLRRASNTAASDLSEVDLWVRKRLGAPDLDVDSNEDLADALEAAGVVEEWVLTKNENRSTARENLMEVILDQQLGNVLGYRGKLATVLRTFLRPWSAMAGRCDGRIHTSWNQVRQTDERKSGVKGARTGRLSSTPNFQNAVKKRDEIITRARDARGIVRSGGRAHLIPRSLINHVHDFPYLRDMVVPGKNRVLLDRDYSQQELRILAHFEGDRLLAAYHADPKIDQHEHAKMTINAMLGFNFERDIYKQIGFGMIYGLGLGGLAERLLLDVGTARDARDAYMSAFPGLQRLIDGLKELARADEPLRTWGGREYFVEPPKVIDGRLRTFEYKMLNVLIQGSAADCTKEALIRFDSVRDDETDVNLTVHDEMLVSTHKALMAAEMRKLREAMESVEFDVPMLSDGKVSTVSWGALRKYREK